MPESINANKITENLNLLSVLLTSQKLYHTAIPLIYRSPHLTTPSQFDNFAHQIIKNPSLGKFTRTLDLTHLAPTRSVTGPWSNNKSSDYNPLFELISRTPLLRNLSLSPYLSDEIDEAVLGVILSSLRHLEVLEFNSCMSPSFTQSFSDFFSVGREGLFTSVVRLSLRGCGSISGDTLQHLLGMVPRLQSLDLSGTQVTVDALNAIPDTVRLRELNLSYCENLDGGDLANFLQTSAATSKNSELTALDIAERPDERNMSDEDLEIIISSLPPKTLRSLNLRNTNLSPSNIPSLKARVEEGLDLEFLSVGSHVRMRDLEALLVAPFFSFATGGESGPSLEAGDQDVRHQTHPGSKHRYASVLSPMEKAVEMCKLRRRLNTIVPRKSPSKHSPSSSTPIVEGRLPALKYLDISSMSIPEQGKIQQSVLLGSQMDNLEVIEISHCSRL
jgi:hypothetical protein